MEKTVQLIKEEIFEALEEKTSWGRNLLKPVILDAISKALARRLDLTESLEKFSEETIAFERSNSDIDQVKRKGFLKPEDSDHQPFPKPTYRTTSDEEAEADLEKVKQQEGEVPW